MSESTACCILRDGPFDMGDWDLFEKIVCFPKGAKKN